jgi:hypothetical protein
MSRRVRRLVILAVVLLLVGTVALVLTGRPRLDDDRSRVDDNWTPLRVPLGMRYDQLAEVLAQLDAAGARLTRSAQQAFVGAFDPRDLVDGRDPPEAAQVGVPVGEHPAGKW